MNPQRQAFQTAGAPAGENPAGDRKRLLALSIAAVVLVDLGLAVLLLEDKNLVSRAAAYIQKDSAPGPVIAPSDQGKGR
ncbi:MAG: hypothetical protein H7X89_03830 [Rhizobiales bacterium]|nr:hypothetical protein [Hyphomicrobiales bacterium]